MEDPRPHEAPRTPKGRIRRGVRRALTVGALVPVVALGLSGPAFAAVTAVTGSATGIKANTTGVLAVSVAETPHVTLPAGGSSTPIDGSLVSLNAPPLIQTGVLNASTQGTPAGGSVTSSAGVDETRLLGVLGANLLSAGVISSECTSDESGSTGSSTIAGLTALGQPVTVSGAPNQTVDILGLGTLHINEQIVAGSGASSSITVNALRLELNILGVAGGEVVIAQSECGVTSDGTTVPTGAIGGVLLTGLAALGFTGYQISRRRRQALED